MHPPFQTQETTDDLSTNALERSAWADALCAVPRRAPSIHCCMCEHIHKQTTVLKHIIFKCASTVVRWSFHFHAFLSTFLTFPFPLMLLSLLSCALSFCPLYLASLTLTLSCSVSHCGCGRSETLIDSVALLSKFQQLLWCLHGLRWAVIEKNENDLSTQITRDLTACTPVRHHFADSGPK